MVTNKLLADVKDLKTLVGLSKTTIYALIKQGSFPKPKQVGRRSLWDVEDLRQWVANLPRQEP